MAETFPVELIDSNPYQPRLDEDAVHVAGLAESLRAVGMLQTPLARPHPERAGRVQLAFGHSRLAAWRIAFPGQPFPLETRELTDRQMSDLAAEENSRRKNLSAIETARAIARRMKDFGLTQLEAGAPFGYQSQGAVSNLLRLLKLPEPVQMRVAEGLLPERAARALVPVAEWRPELAVKIAKDAGAGDPDQRAEHVMESIGDAYHRHGIYLATGRTDDAMWPLEWPQKPIASGASDPAEVPDCNGCRFHVKSDGRHYCLRKACHDIKHTLWRKHQLDVAVAKTGIPTAAKGEKVKVVYEGGWDSRAQARAAKALKAKHPSLRLAALDHSGYNLAGLTGSGLVGIVTVDEKALNKFLEENKGKAVKGPAPKGETAAQRARRVNGEREQAEERWQERCLFHRARADVLWMLDRAAQIVADKTIAAGGLLAWAASKAVSAYNSPWANEINVHRNDLRGAAQVSDVRRMGEYYPAPVTAEVDRARRHYIAYAVITEFAAGAQPPSVLYSTYPKVRDEAARIALKTFGVALPAGWDAPPIHHTHYNCWECGAFAGNDRGFTQAEKKLGWVAFVELSSGKVTVADSPGPDSKLAGCFCPVHAGEARAKLLGQPLAKVLASESRAPAKPNGKYVHGHAAKAKPAPRPLRPAPKPSQKRPTRKKARQPAAAARGR